ncbi:MAG: hypothetical protein AAB909_04010 [Patescibacteria group bacterium]
MPIRRRSSDRNSGLRFRLCGALFPWNFPPRDGIDYDRAKALAERVAQKHSRLHAAYVVQTCNAKKLADIEKVRRDWKLLSRGCSGLDPEAKALLERIRSAYEKAKVLRHKRVTTEREMRREEDARRPKWVESQPKKDDGFLGKGAWGALDELKL